MLVQANNIILDELLRRQAHPHLHPFSLHRLGIDRQGGRVQRDWRNLGKKPTQIP